MARLILRPDGEWIRITGATSKSFIEYLKFGIKPTSYRRYDAETRTWLVHWKQLRLLVYAARRYFDYVDYSELPTDWQMYVVGADIPQSVVADYVEDNPFNKLFVTEDAPNEVIRAAYKALASLYHPDRGGSSEKMAELNLAYDKILASRDQ